MSARDWAAYFAATDTERELRPLFSQALAAYPTGEGLQAVDLGFGHGVETRALLRAGFEVYAVDGAAEAGERLASVVAPEHADRLTVVASDLADAEVPPYDLLWAGLSLFFVPSGRFAAMWSRIVGAARPGGRFAGRPGGERAEALAPVPRHRLRSRRWLSEAHSA